jgi:hypothetical protein
LPISRRPSLREQGTVPLCRSRGPPNPQPPRSHTAPRARCAKANISGTSPRVTGVEQPTASPAPAESIDRKCGKSNKSVQMGLRWTERVGVPSFRTVPSPRIDPNVGSSASAGSHFEFPARSGPKLCRMRAYALVEIGDPKAVEIFLRREDAFAVLEDVLGDEPEWSGLLSVVPIELDEETCRRIRRPSSRRNRPPITATVAPKPLSRTSIGAIRAVQEGRRESPRAAVTLR